MMALFSKSSPLIAASAARDKLRNRLNEAQTAILAATAKASALALDNADDAALDAAEMLVRSRVDRVKTLTAALGESDEHVLALQREEDEAADQKQRSATAVDCHKLIEDLAKEGDVIAASASRLSGIAARIVPIAMEANGLKTFADVAIQQIPDAVTLLSRLVREHAAAVLRRDAPSTVKKPEVPFVPAAVAKPVRMDLFALRSVKYVDPDSRELVLIQKFQDGAFPPTFAKVALEQKIAVRISDPLRKQYHGSVGGHPDAALAFDLDLAMAEPKAAATNPILASAPVSPFKPMDRGGPIQMKVARQIQ
jgi:hypothetical protein